MAIVKTIDENEFVREFDEYNRSDNFSVQARRELFNYYDELSECTDGGTFELDVIAICCDWTEYSKDEIIGDYSYLIDVLDIETDFRDDNDIDSTTDHNDDTYIKFFVESLPEEYQDELDEVIFNAIIEEIENNTYHIKVSDDTYLIQSF